jgi:hypothetical protein
VYGAGTASTAGAKPSADIKIFEYTRDAVPVAGNWEGGRKASPGLWQPGGHFIIDKSGAGELARIGPFGYASDVPVTGDWNGDGRTEVGVWRPGDLSYYLDFNGDGNWDETKGDRKVGPFGFDVSDIPVTGDWNGDGEDEVGVWHHDLYSREGYYYLDVDGDGTWNPAGKDVKFGPFGEIGDVPMSGDWNGDSRDEVAIWDPADGYFYLDMDWDGKWDASKGDLKLGPYGRSHDTPVRGNWDGGNKDKVGVWDPDSRRFYLDMKGDGQWQGESGPTAIDTFKGL